MGSIFCRTCITRLICDFKDTISTYGLASKEADLGHLNFVLNKIFEFSLNENISIILWVYSWCIVLIYNFGYVAWDFIKYGLNINYSSGLSLKTMVTIGKHVYNNTKMDISCNIYVHLKCEVRCALQCLYILYVWRNDSYVFVILHRYSVWRACIYNWFLLLADTHVQRFC